MKQPRRRMLATFLMLFLLPLFLHGVWWMSRDHASDWNTADWSSAHILPAAGSQPEARVYVLGAPTGRWKGIFSLHSWIVIKERGAARYTRYDVVGWGSPVRTDHKVADGKWYGNTPQLIAAFEGRAAEELIPKIRAAVADYPYRHAGDYVLWPGPNSNTFVAKVFAAIPEAHVLLPSNAVGRDWRGNGLYAGLSPTRTGVQVSVFGLFGVTVGWSEGIEVNVLGLVSGLDFRHLGIKLPGWGLIALRDDNGRQFAPSRSPLQASAGSGRVH